MSVATVGTKPGTVCMPCHSNDNQTPKDKQKGYVLNRPKPETVGDGQHKCDARNLLVSHLLKIHYWVAYEFNAQTHTTKTIRELMWNLCIWERGKARLYWL
jgi:hypothetical protein